MRPTQRGWGVLILALAGLGLGVWWRYVGLTAIGGAFVLLVALDAAWIRLAGRVRAQRTVEPLEVPRNGSCTASLHAVHTGRWLGVTADAVEPVGPSHVDVPIGLLRPRREADVEYHIATRRRGLIGVGPLSLRRYGPAGLIMKSDLVGDRVDVRVLPRVLAVQAIPPGTRRGQVGADERVEQGGTDLVGLREYATGDDLRRVHWGASARTGALMIREDADPALAHLAVVLDDRTASYPDIDAFEHAVEVAASLAHNAFVAGHPVRLGGDEFTGGLGALADVSPTESSTLRVAQAGELDVLAVVTGAGADIAALALDASRASAGVVLVVDSHQAVEIAGPVVVLRGPSAEDLLGAWDLIVASGAST